MASKDGNELIPGGLLAGANLNTFEKLRGLQKDVELQTPRQISKMESRARRVYISLLAMIGFAFGLGVFLVVVSLVLLWQNRPTLEVLGLGSVGFLEFATLFFFKPMDRLQIAVADFEQQVIVLRAWELSLNLELFAMDSNNRDSVRTAAKNIKDAAVDLVESLEKGVG